VGRVGEQGMECNAGTVGNAAGQVEGRFKQAGKTWLCRAGRQGEAGDGRLARAGQARVGQVGRAE
jgi:hypothetical protein